ncbi:MAG: XrtA system polysaccharide deacetylase, partial [Candidatus Binatia bacterium]
MLNALTINVEDYFHVSAFESVVDPEDWPRYESRIEGSTRRLLAVLSEHNVRVAFFVLGWVAEHHPGLVREIQGAGHEIACHGYAHRLVYRHSRELFRQDVRRARGKLEKITGREVVGYRAPSYSITEGVRWALQILREEGFRYDSSIFPINHDRYGIPQAHRFPYRIELLEGDGIVELPPSTVRLLGQNIPLAGGGYLRLFPFRFLRWAIRGINRAGQPAILYLHPWELDPGQPRLKAGLISNFRQYVNL